MKRLDKTRKRIESLSPPYLQKPCCVCGKVLAGSHWQSRGAWGLAKVDLLPAEGKNPHRMPDTPCLSNLFVMVRWPTDIYPKTDFLLCCFIHVIGSRFSLSSQSYGFWLRQPFLALFWLFQLVTCRLRLQVRSLAFLSGSFKHSSTLLQLVIWRYSRLQSFVFLLFLSKQKGCLQLCQNSSKWKATLLTERPLAEEQ